MAKVSRGASVRIVAMPRRPFSMPTWNADGQADRLAQVAGADVVARQSGGGFGVGNEHQIHLY